MVPPKLLYNNATMIKRRLRIVKQQSSTAEGLPTPAGAAARTAATVAA